MTRVNVVSLLSEMVSFDTVNAALSRKQKPESPLVDRLEALAKDKGFDTSQLEVPGQSNELLISLEVAPDAPWLLFDSHLDTVSVDGMIVEPFAGLVTGGKLWGRGACDTKGTGAAMFAAMVEYAKLSGTRNNIMLLFSVDEEHGMSGIREFSTVHFAALGRSVKAAIVGEPTGLEPVIAHNGVQRYIISTSGVAAHSSDPSRGRSAVSDMAKLILELESKYIPGLTANHPLTGEAQASINIIRGGNAANIIPERCEIHMDRRTVPGESPIDIVDNLKSWLAAYQAAHAGVEVTFDSAVETPPLTPLHTDVSDRIREVLRDHGRSDKLAGVRYATNAGDLSAAGIPSIVLGPGNIEQGHTKDEWLEVAELEAAVPIYRDIMKNG